MRILVEVRKAKLQHSIRILFRGSLLLLLLTSCIEKDITLNLPEIENNPLAVVAILENDKQPFVLLSRVVSLIDEAITFPVTDASVVLYENGSSIDTLINLPYPGSDLFSSQTDAIFYSRSSLNFNDGSEYTLKVEAEGYATAVSESVVYHQVISSNITVDTVVTDSIDGLFGRIDVIFETLRNINRGEFVVRVSSERTRERYTTTDFSEEKINQNVQFSRWNRSLLHPGRNRSVFGTDLPQGTYHYEGDDRDLTQEYFGQRLSISVTNLTPHYLHFVEPLSRQNPFDIGGLGATPQALPSNIEGGYGYFTILDNQTVYLD